MTENNTAPERAKPSEQCGGTTPDEAETRTKGEWAGTRRAQGRGAFSARCPRSASASRQAL